MLAVVTPPFLHCPAPPASCSAQSPSQTPTPLAAAVGPSPSEACKPSPSLLLNCFISHKSPPLCAQVITHDEQFAHLIGTREFCDSLWRITKDSDQHTLVSQEEIME
jgi:hypothetical protein